MNDEKPLGKKRLSGFVLILALVMLIGAGTLYARYFAAHRAAGQQAYDNMAVFDIRLQNLENTTSLYEKRIKDLEENAQKMSNAQLSPALPPAEKSVSPVHVSDNVEERIAGLEKEIFSLKSTSSQMDNEKIVRSIRLLSTFHRLSEKVMSGKPFALELAAFEDTGKPDESSGSPVATLTPYAESGIPTFATLLVTFDQSVDALNTAEAVPPSDADFWERFKYNLAHIVTIRRINDAQKGNSASAVVSRAQAHLEREEVEAAVAEINSLPESVRANFSGWLDDAKIITEAPSIVSQIEEQVMQNAFQATPALLPALSSAPSPAVSPSSVPPPASNVPTSEPPILRSAPDSDSTSPTSKAL